MPKIKWILIFLLFLILVYTRFINLSWGLPHPMHPDERNMANAIQQLNCEIRNPEVDRRSLQGPVANFVLLKGCFNPNFFAYGQFPLYLGYGIVFLFKFFDGDLGTPVSFEEAVLSLRLMSAVASILIVLVLIKVAGLLNPKTEIRNPKQYQNSKPQNFKQLVIFLLVFTFSPFFIQFSHFGTTESILMFLYTIIVYFSLKYLKGDLGKSFYILTAIFSGLAIASKVSSVIFLVIPITLIFYRGKDTILSRLGSISYLLTLTLIFSILFSPHNFISFGEFLGSMKYESEVALGTYRAFYTRQFEGTTPVLFQFAKIFPNALGWSAFILFLLGFIFLPFKKEFNLVRLAILVGFLSNAFWYAKWTRFLAPILPLMLLFAALFLVSMYRYIVERISIHRLADKYQKFCIFISNLAFSFLIFAFILPGLAYLSIYQNPDVRFTASEWIYQNIPEKSYLLFETANVVDIPITNSKLEIRFSKQIQNSNYQLVSFNFYDLDENPVLQSELRQHLAKADYMFIPSRRIFANHYCNIKYQKSKIKTTNQKSNINVILNLFQNLNQGEEKCEYLRKKYPFLNDYYDKLFSGELGFVKVAEFNAFPKIQLLGKTIIEFPDEDAEETWTVFDHPVIRIYKKI